MISLLERGHMDRASLRLLRQVLSALDATAGLEVRWRGAALDRLLDEEHAQVVGRVAQFLRTRGWLVELEVTYSVFGDRGSFDLLAWHAASGTLLAVEVKTELGSAEATLRKLDEKMRLAARIAHDRYGWRPRATGRLLVLASSPTARRHVERHRSLFEGTLPERNVGIKRWLAAPGGPINGLWFFPVRDGRVPKSSEPSRNRVRLASGLGMYQSSRTWL
jgi:hypothetical protein